MVRLAGFVMKPPIAKLSAVMLAAPLALIVPVCTVPPAASDSAPPAVIAPEVNACAVAAEKNCPVLTVPLIVIAPAVATGVAA